MWPLNVASIFSLARLSLYFYLPELFKLIEKDSKPGRLIVKTPRSEKTFRRKGIYYVWFKDGYLIACSDYLNQKSLIEIIDTREWLSPAVVSRLREFCPNGVPLGKYLHKSEIWVDCWDFKFLLG